MSFAYPLYLLGTLAVALPVLIHLLVKQKRRAMPFSTLRFLRQAQWQRQGRRRLREWLLLLLRVLVCLLIAFALARPVLRHAPGFLARFTNVAAVLIVDNSYSMGAIRDGKSDFERAKELAQRMLNSLPARSRVAVMWASEPPPQELLERWQVGRLTGSLYDGAVNLTQRIEDAQRLLRHANATTKEIVVLTDAQRLSFPPATFNPQASTFGVQLTVVDVRGNVPVENLAIVSGSLREGKTLTPSSWRVSVTVRNTGNASRGATATLWVEGSPRGRRTLPALAPSRTTEVSFPVPPLPVGLHAGWVELSDDALAADNRFYFALPVRERYRVLLVDGTSTTSQGESFYLRAALESLRMPMGKPLMDISTTTGTGLSAAGLAEKDVVVFTSAPPLDPSQRDALKQFIASGGGVWICLGERTRAQEFNRHFAQTGLAPMATAAAVVTAEGVHLSALDFMHPALSVFDNPQSADVMRAKFRRYFRLSGAPASRAKVLARFNNGDAALVEQTTGFGRVLLFASGVHVRSNDLPLTKSFVAWVHQLMFHLAASRRHNALTVGATLNVSSGELIRPDGAKQKVQGTIPLTQAGIYKLASPQLALLPVNPDTAESDLTRLTEKDLKQRYGDNVALADASQAPGLPARSVRTADLWQPLMWLVLVLLFVEMVFGYWSMRVLG
ncbi:MAG: BatA domain-containing protein [Abditibacteriales bacterium]|nr:BatA domain-containing protein [Abditibacteriales bacterium]MDW8365875.1 BatA domain-containing protein [Abditibacteriales bacterium]